MTVHSLSLDEAALLARQLPNLGALLRGERATSDQQRTGHRELVRRLLHVVQGHPKLIELAEGQASNPSALAAHLARAEAAWARGAVDAGRLNAFFREGDSQVEAGAFLQALAGWTEAITTTLPVACRTLFQFLCGVEEEDRLDWVVQAVWPVLWKRLALPGEAPIGMRPWSPWSPRAWSRCVSWAAMRKAETRRSYAIHPGVAEAGRSAAGEAFQAAVDTELAAFWKTVFKRAQEQESHGAGSLVIRAGRGAAPYLMRQQRWAEASWLLKEVVYRDRSPATLAAVLPLLRRLAEATRGTERELSDAGVLARTLLHAGCWREAEAMMEPLMDRAAERGDFRGAGAIAGDLVTLLMQTGRAEQALGLVERRGVHPSRGPGSLDAARR